MQLRDGAGWRSVEIVGVAGPVLHFGYYRQALTRDLRGFPFVYIPHTQVGAVYAEWQMDHHMSLNFVVRTSGEPRNMAEIMRLALREADPDIPVVFAEPASRYLSENLSNRRFQMLLIGMLAVVALIMALVGIYGIIAFNVRQRLHEIGVRLALGAHSGAVIRMIVSDGARVAVLGVLVGIAGAMGATRLLSPWLYGVSPTEPRIFLALAALMVTVAILACWLPARRAGMVDPVESLRAE